MKIKKAFYGLIGAGMLTLLIMAGCAKNGSNGATGVQGQPGPLSAAPIIAGLDPTMASFNTVITVTGENFTATPTVYCDGVPAMLVSATSTQLTVTGCGKSNVPNPYQASVSVLVSKQMSNAINEWIVPSGYITQFPAASLTGPQGVVNDSSTGKLYVADDAGVFAVDNATGWTTQIVPAGCPTCTLSAPSGITMDNSGNLIVADSGNNILIGINPTTSATWYILAPGNGLLNAPVGVTYSNGDLYVANSGSSKITQINVSNSQAVSLTLNIALPSAPYGITADGSGNLYVACRANNTVSKIVVTGSNGTVTNGYVTGVPSAYGISISGTSLAVTSNANPNVYTAPLTGGAAAQIGCTTFPWESGTHPASSVISDGSNGLFVGDPSDGLVYHVNNACNVSTYAAGFAGASDIVYYNGNFYVPNWYFQNSTYGDALFEIRSDGAMKVFAQIPGGPEAVTVAPSGNLTVASYLNAIYNVSSTGIVSTLISGGGLNSPTGVAYDTTGDLYINNYGNDTIAKYSGGVLTTSWATTIGSGYQIAIRNSVVYIADFSNGSIDTVSIPGGGGVSSYIPSTVGLSRPIAVEFDLLGNLIICDFSNAGIFRADPQGHVTALVPAATSPMSSPYGVAIAPSQLIYTVEENYSTPLTGKMWVIAP